MAVLGFNGGRWGLMVGDGGGRFDGWLWECGVVRKSGLVTIRERHGEKKKK